MKRIFSQSILVLLIIAGIVFIIAGIYEYESPENREWTIIADNSFMNYTNEIKGFSYLLTGTFFIFASLYLIVRMKDTQ